MTQAVLYNNSDPDLFSQHQPKALRSIKLIEQGPEALIVANLELGMALSTDEIEKDCNLVQKCVKKNLDTSEEKEE